MQLSPKAIRFIIEAIEFYQKDQEMRLQDPKTSEDDASDIGNDHQYLEQIKTDLKTYHDELIGK